jgi:hypothetical protein
VLNKIDIKAGRLTYGQRCELGELFAGDKTEVDKFKGAFQILYKITPDFRNSKEMKLYVEHFREIIDGLRFWLEKEKLLLDYNPEPEEVRAGIKDLSAKISHYGTIKTLAKNYAQDPDAIFNWEYGKVFGIIYTDLEEYKYRKRLYKEYERKFKKK